MKDQTLSQWALREAVEISKARPEMGIDDVFILADKCAAYAVRIQENSEIQELKRQIEELKAMQEEAKTEDSLRLGKWANEIWKLRGHGRGSQETLILSLAAARLVKISEYDPKTNFPRACQ